ncbi:MAG: peptidylprolyl isomerase [Rickettsiales bacterium]|nr:peptidylprolyl isomerase [Rickettsiales bacterium]
MSPSRTAALLAASTLLFAAAPALAAEVLGSVSSSTAPAASAAPAGKTARPDFSIAAVVGDEAISSYDVENRLRFIIATARISNTPDVLKVIRPQIIRSLIDEKLQMQEAARNNITATPQDITTAIAAIEQERAMPPGTIYGMLAQAGVPKETFQQQIKAQLLWNKLLMRKVRPNVRVSDEELKIGTRKFSLTPPKKKEAPAVPQEYKIAVIALPVEKKEQENSVRALAAKLVQQIRGGASFEEVSRQFSSVAANAGGKVESFWVRLGQLDANVAQTINGAPKGTVTDPVRSAAGYTVIKIYDTRPIPGYKPKPAPKEEEEPKDTEINVKDILLKVKPDAEAREADVMLQIGGEVAKNPGTCEEETVASIANTQDMEDMDIAVAFKTYMLSEMDPAMKEVVDKLEIGGISAPIATYEGIRLVMLCGKKASAQKLVNKDVVFSSLIQDKMQLEAQKYMRNLRRTTFVDVRQ